MRIAVIGAVAAGTSAAAKARRNDDTAQIRVYEKDSDISYSGCGLPYYIGGEVESIGSLVPRDAAFFKSKYNVDIFTRHEVLSIDREKKELTVQNLEDGTVFIDAYDVLVLATGALPVVPPIPGAQNANVFVLRNPSSAVAINKLIEHAKPTQAVIVGSGFIGLEMAESLHQIGLDVTIIEKLPTICPSLDTDMAPHLHEYLAKMGIKIITGCSAAEINTNSVVLDNGSVIDAQLVILAVGVRPNVKLAKEMGIELGITGAIKVNSKMQTNLADVYSCGDCAESTSIVDGQPLYRPLGSTANKMGRIAGDVITGGDMAFRGIAGTGIFKVFELTVASTGLKEDEAIKKGFDVVVCHNIKPDRPDYFHGKEMVIKAIADRKTQKLLGVQIVGFGGVDKRMDVFVTAMTFGAKVSDLFHLDLAYAPPFSTTKDPVMYTGMILENAINRGRELLTNAELLTTEENSITVIDARVEKQYAQGHADGAVNIPHDRLRQALADLEPSKPVVIYCNKGTTGNAAQNILLNHGFKKVYNLSGGYKQYKTQKKQNRGV